jgi:hypothetical protein
MPDTDPPVLHHALIHDDVPYVLLYGVELGTSDDQQPLPLRHRMTWPARAFGLILPGEGDRLPPPGHSVHVSPTDPDDIILVGPNRRNFFQQPRVLNGEQFDAAVNGIS